MTDDTATEQASVDLTDEEIALIVSGLHAISADEPKASDLIEKLGFQP